MTSGKGLTLMCGSNVFTVNDSGISQASSQIATSSKEDKVDAEKVNAEDAEAPAYGDFKVTKLKAEKEEQEKHGDVVEFEIEEIEMEEDKGE